MENEASYYGNLVEDDLCLDDDADICVQNFSFYCATQSQNVKIDERNIKYDGVIPLNRNGMPELANQRLVNLLQFEDILSNSTL